ncbi:MAG: hypothetical protein SF002_07920 [Alphaproteobacteria bacterium]|nr:hypothetical protein [Alphaproteobacteria bacterium]
MILSPRLFLLWLVLISVTGIGVYQLKYLTQQQERLLVQINRQIQADQDAIDILKAEWSFLNQPAELERLAKRFRPDLEPVQGRQMFASVAAIPVRTEPTAAPGPRRTGPLPTPQVTATRGSGAPPPPSALAIPAPPPAPTVPPASQPPVLVRTTGSTPR